MVAETNIRKGFLSDEQYDKLRDELPQELKALFVAGYITGLRFYKGSLNTGPHIGHLWSATGALLAEATFCWDEMPDPTRKWMRERRSPEAEHWNVVSLMQPEDSTGGDEVSH
jgi:hypothetical protein